MLSLSEWKNSISIALVLSTRMFGLFMIYPILAIDITNRWSDTNLTLIGMALGFYGLTQALFQIPFGLLSDRFGRKKMIVIGLVLFFIGSILAAEATSIYQLIIGRAVQGSGAISAVLLALLADSTREKVRMRAMAFVGMSIGLSFIFSLIVGPIIYPVLKLSGMFYLIALFAVIGMIIIIFLSSQKKVPKANNKNIVLGFFDVVKIKSLYTLNGSVFIIHACLTSLFLYFPNILLKNNIELDHHWLVYLSTMLASTLIIIPFILIAEKKNKKKHVMTISLVLMMFINLYLMFNLPNTNINLLLLLLTLFFAGFSILEAILPSQVSKIVSSELRGSAMGIFSSFQFLGTFFGGAIGGLLIQLFSLKIMMFVMSVLLFTTVFIIFISYRNKNI